MEKNYAIEIWITSDEVPTVLIDFITKQSIRISFGKMKYEEDTEDTSILRFETKYSRILKKIMNFVEKNYKKSLYQAVAYETITTEKTTKLIHLI